MTKYKLPMTNDKMVFCGCAVFICSIFVSGRAEFKSGSSLLHFGQSKNNPPKVKILSPKNNSVHPLNILIRYSVTVSDVEDGESKYDEIPSGKIFLEVKHVIGSSDTLNKRKQSPAMEPVGLTLIRNSDCFTCHQFKAKLIGPSFQEIARQYTKTTATKQLLANRITEGSTGIWGEIMMPAHSDLTREASENIVDWILDNGANPNLNYLVGKEGAIRIEPPPADHNGFFVLKASYVDKGLQDRPKEHLRGEDEIIIRYK